MVRIVKDEKFFFENLHLPIFIYGCTKIGRHLADFLKKCGEQDIYFIDQYPLAHDKDYFGIPIIGIDEIAVKTGKNLCSIILTVNSYDSVLLELYKRDMDIMVEVLTPKKTDNGYIKSNQLLSPLRNRLLKKKNISIISNNCSDMLLYNALGMKPQSPFISAGTSQEDFLKLAQNFEYYLNQKLIFDGYEYKGITLQPRVIYPTGRLGDLRLSFVHCKNWEMAETLWKNQVKKVNLENVYWVLSDFQEIIKYPIVKEFSKLDVNKCILLSKSMYFLPGVNYLAEGQGNFLDKVTVIEEWFDLVGWINHDYEL